MMLQIGQKAPEFPSVGGLPDQDGRNHTLSGYLGKWVLLYFYPKDDTPGCTTEACGFRDNLPKLQNIGAVVLGVSADSVASHKKFEEKFGLPFPLLSDESKKTIEAYGVWQEKSMYGKTYMGIARTSFLIDPQGNIAKIYEKVKPDTHPQQVFDDLVMLKNN